NTVAGNGSSGNSKDGSLATSVSLNDLSGIAIDQSGNLFFTETSAGFEDDNGNMQVGTSRIRRVDAGAGIITTVAGIGDSGFNGDGGPAINANLNVPTRISFDAAGNLI